MKRSGRPLSNPVHEFFTYNEETDESICKEENCKRPRMSGKHAGNLVQHLKSTHEKKYIEYVTTYTNKNPNDNTGTADKYPKIKIQMSPNVIRQCCVELVTVHGRPFSLLEDKAFQNIVTPITSAFNPKDKFTITVKNTKDDVTLQAKITRDKIKEELKQAQLVSLKYDVASRHGKSFLGVNVQFISNAKIQLRTLAVMLLKEKHTAVYLKNLIIDIINEYDIDLNNIYTCTSDNGSNMIKLSSLLNEDQKKEWSFDFEDELENETADNNCVNPNTDIEDNELYHNLLCEGLIVCVRCAAHTLQLCVWDVLKKNMDKTTVKARSLVKALRTETMMNALAKYNIKRPILDNQTRWSSTYLMLQSLLDAKQFCRDFSVKDETFSLSSEDWDKIEECVAALKPVSIATIQFQREQLLPGDFYGNWLQCYISVQKLKSKFAKDLLNSMKTRQDKLLDNDAFLAALFLDPRYMRIVFKKSIDNDLSVLLKESKAKKTIMKIWEHLKNNINKSNDNDSVISSPQEESQEISTTEDNDDTDLDKYLQEIDGMNNDTSENINAVPIQKIESMLNQFQCTPRIDRKENLLEYWEKRKLTDPELYILAMITNAVPMTQVSVERLFSGMKFIYSDLRGNLSSELLKDILLVRTNGFFFNKSNNIRKKSKSTLVDSTQQLNNITA